MAIYMYIAPGQGQMYSWGQFIFQNHKYPAHFAHFLEGFPFRDIFTIKSTHCSTLVQHVSTHCSTLVQRLTTHCITLVQRVSTHCSTLVQRLTTHCSTLVPDATCQVLVKSVNRDMAAILTM